MQLEDILILIESDSLGMVTGVSVRNNIDHSEFSNIIGSMNKIENCIQCKTCSSKIELNLFVKEQKRDELADIKQESSIFIPEVIVKEESSESHPQIYEKNRRSTNNIEKELSCDACSKQFKTKSGLTMHLKFCKFLVSIPMSNIKREILVEPIEITQDNIKSNSVQSDQKWTCDVCDKVFKKRIDLKFHHKFCNSDKGPPSCEFCSKRFKTWKSVRNHKRLKHEKEIRFTCEICGFGTQRQETLNRHIFKTHFGNPRPFICDICNKRFPSKGSISYHIQLKHLNLGNHICEVCSMKFIAKSSLDAHILAKHTTEKNYSCPECPKQFKSAQHVKAHLYKVHIPTELKPRYTCNQCEYVTHDKKSFNNHEILHRDDREKPHQCKYCSKGFVTLNNQLRHEMTHTNERPYDCEVCGKSFRAKADLKVHSRYHTGEKPYECEICQQRYSDRGCYRAHLIGHEKQLGITLDKSIKKFLDKPKKISSIPRDLK